jgi:hypothetical protein
MFRTQTDIFGVLDLLAPLREAVLVAAGMDAAREPVPFVGRSPRDDVLCAVSYLGALLERAARAAGCTSDEIAERAIDGLSSAKYLAPQRPAEPTAELATIIPLR